ncbi:MAG: NUDIX domain-containing protein [Gemmatimonadetes bacterium]|nr:NUDIX domain-containing protein [Gemmatimonadota bacterium]
MRSETGSEETEDPQSRIEREEFQRGHVPQGTPPVEPRPAATIVVTRPTGRGRFEVLLLERPQASSFAAGAFVFPGGVVDEEDGDEIWATRLPATTERPACAAAFRELFEETGILPVADGLDRRALGRDRTELLAGRVAFTEIARARSLDFTDARVAYFSRWITPRSLSRRYDTRFFLLLLEGDVDVSLTEEHDSAGWFEPEPALERFHAGDLPMLFPTRKTLERLAGFETVDGAFEALRDRAVEPILAKLDIRGDHIRPVMPGDDGYEEAY